MEQANGQTIDSEKQWTSDNGKKIKLVLENLRTVHLLCRINIYDNGLSNVAQLTWLSMPNSG